MLLVPYLRDTAVVSLRTCSGPYISMIRDVARFAYTFTCRDFDAFLNGIFAAV